MPPRRDSPPSSRASSQSRDSGRTRGGSSKAAGARWRWPALPRPTKGNLVTGGFLVLGALAGSLLLGLVWREPDRAGSDSPEISPSTLAEKPRRPITVLVIGLDSERIGDAVNHAAPAGPPGADALLLVRVNPKGPLQVLNLPVELAVRIPGSAAPVGLGALYQRGGVALTADVVRELVGLEPPRPDRYLVLPRSALRRIVDRVGGLELSPPQVMRYQDKAQKYKIDLQSGLQRLNGSQVEQLVRFRDPGLGDSGRRIDHQLVETGLRERFRRPEQVSQLPDLLRDLQGQVETNLSARESLSLLAAGLDDQRPIQFTRLPLKPANKDFGGLRQLDVPPDKALWKTP
ncbi:MAG: LCP family protein [Cyanobacteria bacterium]|nr:LCP family protein [Cyanobacteriota bacterium]